jgi:hypothetical protein
VVSLRPFAFDSNAIGEISNGPAEEVRSGRNSSDIQSSPKQIDGAREVNNRPQRTRRLIEQLQLPKTQDGMDPRVRTRGFRCDRQKK